MWNWYNRPGGRQRWSTGTAILIMVVAGLLVGVFFTLVYFALAPLLFTKVPMQ